MALAVLLLHAAVIALLSRPGTRIAGQAGNQGAVELLMVEQKGSEAKPASPPAETPPPPVPPAPQASPSKPQPEKPPPPAPTEADAEPAPPNPPEAEKTEARTEAKPAPPEAEAKVAEPPAKPRPPAPPAAKPLTFDLTGTDSDTNAKVLSGEVLPAAPDNRFRNRPPPYPLDAAIHNESGDVEVLIHVTAGGIAAGVDIVNSSGWPSLDQAAVTAVKKWRFHPALKDGQPVPFDMPFIFNFRPY